MDDRTDALRGRRRPAPASAATRAPGTGSAAARYRRRRAVAMLGLALLMLLVGLWLGSGGGSPARHRAAGPSGFFGRIQGLAGSGAGSFAAQQQGAESAAIDRTLASTPFVITAGAQNREIALTFDDGPGPFTPRILSVLAQQKVPATFFEVGALERYFHASTTEIVARGYPIGDHTQAHAPMSKLSAADQRAQLLQQVSAAGNYGAPFPRLFRPPYGLYNRTTLALLRSFKMLMVLWTVDTEDYKLPGVAAIVNSAVSGARPGAIILMHDAGGQRQQTIAALPQIVLALRARGYRLVTVPRLLLDNPAPTGQQDTSGGGTGG